MCDAVILASHRSYIVMEAILAETETPFTLSQDTEQHDPKAVMFR